VNEEATRDDRTTAEAETPKDDRTTAKAETPNDDPPRATAGATAAEIAQNRKNLGKVGQIHLVMLLGALTLWAAADAWATTSSLGIATLLAVANAIVAATVIAGIVHEWGHYFGARSAGARTQVLDKPINYFFIFQFPFEHNDRDQFLAMSWGGILAPWLPVALVAALIPIDNPGRAMLLAAFVTRAVQVGVFEVPVAGRTRRGGDPQGELERQLVGGFTQSRYAGLAVGALVWLAV
jgi:hypothetical protein